MIPRAPLDASALYDATRQLRRASDASGDRWRVYTVGRDGLPKSWPVLDRESFDDAAGAAALWFAMGVPDVRVIDRRSGVVALALTDRIPPSVGIRQ